MEWQTRSLEGAVPKGVRVQIPSSTPLQHYICCFFIRESLIIKRRGKMKYIKQFAIILFITFLGELLRYFIPIKIPATIYGIIIMLVALMTKIIKVDDIKDASSFLIEIMPLMFISLAANLINLFDIIKPVIIPLLIIIPITTAFVMILTGKFTDLILIRGKKNE